MSAGGEPAAGEFVFPPTESVRYGPGALAGLGALVEGLGGRRVFAVGSTHLGDLEARLGEILGDRLVGLFTEAEMHVPRHSALAAAEAARAAAADIVVSVGGGTQIDCASAVGLALAAGITETDEFDRYRVRFTYPDKLEIPAVDLDLIPHVAAPTTLSGAESTNLFGLTDRERNVKDVFSNPRFGCRAIVFDPLLTADVPDWLWASSGMRAVDHAVESVLSSRHMPFADALALEGLRILLAELPGSAADPGDVRARMRCQLGAWLSIYGTGNVGVGLSHGIGHQLGAQFGMVHGVTSACMLPHVMELNAPVTGPQLRRIGEAFGAVPTDSDEGAAAVAVRGMHEFVAALEPLGVPHTLAAAGARREELPAVAEHALGDMSVLANPLPLERDDLEQLLERAWN